MKQFHISLCRKEIVPLISHCIATSCFTLPGGNAVAEFVVSRRRLAAGSEGFDVHAAVPAASAVGSPMRKSSVGNPLRRCPSKHAEVIYEQFLNTPAAAEKCKSLRKLVKRLWYWYEPTDDLPGNNEAT